MESNLFAPSPLQNDLEPRPDRRRISGGILIDWGGEHPAGSYSMPVCPEYIQDRSREDDAAIGGLGFWRRDDQSFFGPVNLPLYPEFPGAKV